MTNWTQNRRVLDAHAKLYEPALCLQLTARNVHATRLYAIFAADGTQLDVIEERPESVPLWVAGLVQLATVDVLPSEYKRWKSAAAAVRL